MKQITQESAMTPEARIMMLEMQVDELETRLDEEITLHRKASARAAAAERRNRQARDRIDFMEGDLRIAASCWSCPDLGNKEICAKCGNNSIFAKTSYGFEWRGYSKGGR